MDLLPTFAALAGTTLPASLRIDGVDASEFLLGKSPRSPRTEYLYYTGCLLTGIRQHQWKLVIPRPAAPPGTGWWGRLIERIAEPQLFDLTADPGETTNLAPRHPDLVATLSQRLEAARAELGDIDRTGSGARFFEPGPRKLQVPLPTAAKP
jgi:arylsulfatase A-like enzyme